MGERRIGILTPVLNDWASLQHLLTVLADLRPQLGRLEVIVVDDCSTLPEDAAAIGGLAERLGEVEIIRLACNMGHQRAIAIGLVEVARRRQIDVLVVMDADGEDRPEDIHRLLTAHQDDPEAIIVAGRANRSEGAAFRLFYAAYKATFRLCAGVSIDFGNFCLIPSSQLGRLVARPELWNHLAGTIIRSRAVVRRVPTDRGRRYAGTSHMNIVSLVAHGLSAISVFSTETFVRFLVLSAALVAAILGVIGVAVGVRLFTDLAIPGWATTIVGIALVMLLQICTMMLALTFVMLANRTAAPVIPTEHARHYIRAVDVIAPR